MTGGLPGLWLKSPRGLIGVKSMSLRKKLFFKDIGLLVSLLLMVGSCLWGLRLQRTHVRSALNEYGGMELVQSADVQVIAFKEGLHDSTFDRPKAVAGLRDALHDLRRYKALIGQYDNILPPEIPADRRSAAKAKTRTAAADLTRLIELVAPAPGSATPNVAEISQRSDQLIGELTDLLAICNDFQNRTQLASDRDIRNAIIVVSIIAVATILISLLASVWQYRLIMVPLQRLRRWCRRIAGGDFSTPYRPSAAREFRELGDDVNKMAGELRSFYERLEEMVATKSRELIRSERLASVGYLAAGVAHEINSPLNIMSGYAELSLRRLRRGGENDANARVIEHLAIIRSEAFRCKAITQKLLSLAAGNGDARQIVRVSDAVDDVVSLVRGLKNVGNKKLTARAAPGDTLCVHVNATEFKQVLLNLIVNALDAVEPGSGNVAIDSRREEEWVELQISDNGRGMSDETRERAFEPFFTNKRGAGEPGTGLGLSITHAIVTSHGGRISAHSDGPGRGSRFTVRLPACARRRCAERGEPMAASSGAIS